MWERETCLLLAPCRAVALRRDTIRESERSFLVPFDYGWLLAQSCVRRGARGVRQVG